MKESYIYVIGLMRRNGKIIGPCKIGTSNNPHNRLQTMQTGNHHPLALVLSLRTPAAYPLEQEVHEWLQSMGVERRGEWFMLSPSEAVHVVFKHHLFVLGVADNPECWPRVAKVDVQHFNRNYVEIRPEFSAVKWAI